MSAILQAADIYLAKANFEDWSSMYQNIWSRPESNRYMLWELTTDEEAAKLRIERTIEYQKTHNTYLVYEKLSGQAIGFAGLEIIVPCVFQETGIALGPDYMGKGYGKQILRLLLKYAASLGGKEFFYSTRAANTASVALALSCGFTYHHSLPKQDPRNGESYELVYYRKTL